MKPDEFITGLEALAKREKGTQRLRPGLSEKQLAFWRKKNPALVLPDDYLNLLRRHNGFNIGVDLEEDGVIRFLPLKDLASIAGPNVAREMMWGNGPDGPPLPASWVCIAMDGNGDRLLVLDTATGHYLDVPPLHPQEPELTMDDLDAALTWVENTYDVDLAIPSPEEEARRKHPGPKVKPPELQEAFSLLGHTQSVKRLEFIHGTDMLVSGSAPIRDDGVLNEVLRFWSLTSRSQIPTSETDLTNIADMAVSSSGGRFCVVTFTRDWRTPYGIQAYAMNASAPPIQVKMDMKPVMPDRSIRPINVAAFLPDDCRVLTIYEGGTLRIINTLTGSEEMILKGHRGEVFIAAVSPDGRLAVSGGKDKTLRLWDLTTFQEIERFPRQRYPVASAEFSPAGDMLAVGTPVEKVARVLDVATGTVISELVGHLAQGVRTFAFCPDGRRIVSGGSDGYVRLWETRTGKPLGAALALVPDKNFCCVYWPINDVVVTPDGRLALTAGEDRRIRAWTLPS